MRSANAALRTFLRLWLIFDHKNGPLMVIYLRSVSCYFGLTLLPLVEPVKEMPEFDVGM